MTTIRLSELCEHIQDAIQARFDDTYWVSAEISSLSAKAGGHCYLELVEKQDNSSLSAKVRATCWANTWAPLSLFFTETTGLPLQVGMHILVEVSVTFHPVYGLSLTILNINPEFTIGDLMRQRRETIARLEEEGMMELQQSIVLPTLVQRVAVVSSPDAAGYQDFVHQLSASPFAFRHALFTATMQGDKAAMSIMGALDKVFEQVMQFDIVVIIRGGGATTDLTCFDNYELCAYCAQFPLPILSGIGHTRDVSVLDMVAYEAVKTPTAAAEWLISRMQEQAERLDRYASRLRETALRQVAFRREQLSTVTYRLSAAVRNYVAERRHRLDLIEQTVRLHSPEAIFRRGYSLTLKDGKPVHSAAELHPGDTIQTLFASGEASSRVEKCEE